MSAGRWAAVALGAALLGGVPPAGAEPTPAAQQPPAPPGKTLREEDQIARMIKSAEREGFERHELDRAMAIYDPAGVWIRGRREVADAHDVRLDFEHLRAMLKLRFDNPLTGQEQVFFRDMLVDIEGDRATVTTAVARELFTGREELRHRYTLARRDGRWRVTELRSWPTMRMQGGVPTIFTDEHWLEAESKVEKVLADPAATGESRLFALINAGYLPEGYAQAKAWTAAEPNEANAWRARAMFALEVGEVQDALAAARKARALNPEIGLSPMLAPEPAGRK